MRDAIELKLSHRMDAKDETNFLDGTAQGVIHAPLDRPDGPLKATGRATYADEDHPAGTVYGFFVRSPIGKGFVTGLNKAELMAMPGVLAVLRDDRMLQTPAQGQAGKAPMRGPSEILYVGQPIALVVAETFEQARHAALNARPELIERKPAVSAEPSDYATPKAKQSAQGDLDRAMTEAAHRLDVTYTTPSMTHAAMEPHAAVAWWEDGRLTVRGSYQMLKFNKAELADALGVRPKDVRILSPFVGGGFGSKLGISHEAVAAAIAAKKLGRPVAIALHRRNVCEATTRRSESRQRVRLAADAEGRLTGFGHEAWVSSLPGESFSEPVTQASPFTYAGENRVIGHHVASLNVTNAGSMRAPGEAIGVPVIECAMDELAEATGIDPIDLRLRNIPEDEPGTGRAYSSHRMADCLRAGAEAFGWDQRQPAGSRREGEWLVGIGMATAVRVNMLQESEATVILNPDGTARVETDMTDIGTGSYAILTQIVAEALGLPMDRVTTVLGDSELPPASGSGGSFGAASAGSSVLLAAQAVRAEIARRLEVDPEELTLKDGAAIAGNRILPLAEILDGDSLKAKGHIQPGLAEKTVRQASWGAQFAEVAVSALTGEVRVRRLSATFATGRILNEKTARSQCIGGMIFGIGAALMEEVQHDPRDGHFVNRDLAEYHVPANLDVPHIDVTFLPDRDPYANPMQAKGIGEVAICGTAGAILNAIHNATGVRIRDFPATPDKLIAHLPMT
ncbi:xanthine dehydrogenase family protein molybdopterin-binding subunit [Paracoccus sp. (in: a-proteobacteria)]|uniref:xanthine dehydrogenase family protein molybdopterin-binding subunit n=1 Tax=Paracoccus sp. TaxID=267 RepID=UPI0026DFA937|nr:xanthine dehydrogenase family protein molybdopterin-binding subunit [Paracoccus sp. (in: a-proteobacteria)]MDO5368851.1 xanthine dehydrogenase family protein molybdopterin-binding subunit [Paracoccus sp. (in: a-proteobacteria)]